MFHVKHPSDASNTHMPLTLERGNRLSLLAYYINSLCT